MHKKKQRDQLTKFWKLEIRSLLTLEDGTPVACTEGSQEVSSLVNATRRVWEAAGIGLSAEDKRWVGLHRRAS